MKSKRALYIIISIIILWLFFGSLYVVDETEQVLIIQFGKVIGESKTKPGLYYKVPIIQQVNRFRKNLLDWDGAPDQIPTLNKTFIWVDTFARWKIVDPLKFYETVNNETEALSRLDDIIEAAVRNVITSYPLIEIVRVTNRQLEYFEVEIDQVRGISPLVEIKKGRVKIARDIMSQAQTKLTEFGIALTDVKIKRINYIEEVQKSVFDRMIAERKQIAEKFRSEGRGEARKIEGDMESDLKKITSEAYRTAQEIKGKADAEATRIYAKAYDLDADFYSFINTLNVYVETMDKDSTLILSTDSELFKFMKSYMGQR
jgi:membrane protease subunit HflC